MEVDEVSLSCKVLSLNESKDVAKNELFHAWSLFSLKLIDEIDCARMLAILLNFCIVCCYSSKHAASCFTDSINRVADDQLKEG